MIDGSLGIVNLLSKNNNKVVKVTKGVSKGTKQLMQCNAKILEVMLAGFGNIYETAGRTEAKVDTILNFINSFVLFIFFVLVAIIVVLVLKLN